MSGDIILKRVKEFAAENMIEYDGGHDIWHLDRVRNLAIYIHEKEKSGNRLILELASLLHDIGDSKFKKGYGINTSEILNTLLKDLKVDNDAIEEVIFINQNISFSKGQKPGRVSEEFMIVQDADRLDAIGAIGIARAFNYGGFRNNLIYDPTGESPSTIAHFHDKLLKLKDLMNTETGRRLSDERHNFIESFLIQFYKEWNGPV